MLFVCGPDQTFSEKGKGPSGVDWGTRFSQYKYFILRLTPEHRSHLLSWYDQHIFGGTTSSVVQTNATPSGSTFVTKDLADVLSRLDNADIDSESGSYSTPPELVSHFSPSSPLPFDAITDDAFMAHPGILPSEQEPEERVAETVLDDRERTSTARGRPRATRVQARKAKQRAA